MVVYIFSLNIALIPDIVISTLILGSFKYVFSGSFPIDTIDCIWKSFIMFSVDPFEFMCFMFIFSNENM
jgi:hypothetical protein